MTYPSKPTGPKLLRCARLALPFALVGLVATSLHGLSSNGNVIGKPDSTKAADAIAQAFPQQADAAKADVIVISSRRYAVNTPRFRAFAKRNLAALRATGVFDVRVAAVSPDRHSVLVSLHIGSDSDAKPVEDLVAKANGGGLPAGAKAWITRPRTPVSATVISTAWKSAPRSGPAASR